MNNKKNRTSRLLFLLAVTSFMIAAVQGALYYSSYKPFFKVLLVLQNGINAFGFKATITIKDVVAFINNDPNILNRSVGYAYCIAVFTAPYCTISFMYKFLERLLRLIIGFRSSKNCEHILIFGYNSDVKALLRNNRSFDKKKACIHIITSAPQDSSEVYRLNKLGYMLHLIDVLKTPADELPSLMEKTCADLAENILLFEESSIRNFSLLQLFCLTEADSGKKIRLKAGAKVSCRCEEEGIGRLIAGYYDSAAGKDMLFDLELISLPEMQIRKMYSDIPLHSFWNGSNTPLRGRYVHLLVAGLGQLGQQAVLQAMNLGVLHEQNSIVIDVFDKNISAAKQHFTNQFSDGSFDITDSSMTLRSDTANGKLTVNFYGKNAEHRDFYDLIRNRDSELPYTYAVITPNDIDLAVNTAIQLNTIFGEKRSGVPVIMRMDSDRRLADYISSGNGDFSGISLIDDRSFVITLDMIISRIIDRRAKEYNHFYNNIAIISGSDSSEPDNSSADPEREWNSIRLFRRSSSKAAACHDEVKDMIIPALAAENGVQLDRKLEELIGTNGSLLKFTGKAWRMTSTEQQLMDKLRADSFAYSLASLEHRRWCCYMASIGWKCGSRDDRFRRNPCMVTQEKLMELMPDMCKYDLMSLMARFISAK